jgi:hypothetical protein
MSNCECNRDLTCERCGSGIGVDGKTAGDCCRSSSDTARNGSKSFRSLDSWLSLHFTPSRANDEESSEAFERIGAQKVGTISPLFGGFPWSRGLSPQKDRETPGRKRLFYPRINPDIRIHASHARNGCQPRGKVVCQFFRATRKRPGPTFWHVYTRVASIFSLPGPV